MGWVNLAVAAAGAYSAYSASEASGDAADAQVQSADKAADAQLSMFRENKNDLRPWTQAGGSGLNSLLKYIGVEPNGFDPNAPGMRPFGAQDLEADEGYKFRLREGTNNILNRRSSMGGLMSGNTLRELQSFGQGLASDEYGRAYGRYNENVGRVYNRLSGLSDTGANAAGGIAGLGASAAARAGEYMTQGGNAQAAGIVGQNNALGSGVNSLMNNWLQASAQQQRNRLYDDTMTDFNTQAFSDPYYRGY